MIAVPAAAAIKPGKYRSHRCSVDMMPLSYYSWQFVVEGVNVWD